MSRITDHYNNQSRLTIFQIESEIVLDHQEKLQNCSCTNHISHNCLKAATAHSNESKTNRASAIASRKQIPKAKTLQLHILKHNKFWGRRVTTIRVFRGDSVGKKGFEGTSRKQGKFCKVGAEKTTTVKNLTGFYAISPPGILELSPVLGGVSLFPTHTEERRERSTNGVGALKVLILSLVIVKRARSPRSMFRTFFV